MSNSSAVSAPSQCATRQREVDNAVLVQALLGRQLTASILAQLRRYVAGELNREQAFASLYSNR